MTQPSIRLRKDLRTTFQRPAWPHGLRIVPFDPQRHAPALHRLIAEAYSNGGGEIAGFPEWWAALRSDDEYDPDLVFVAVDRLGRIVGAAQCWTSGFVKDLAVERVWRRRGLGAALLLHAFSVFWDRGRDAVDLKVEVGNPSGAERLYRALGMKPVPGPA